jgi:hypothetical protein
MKKISILIWSLLWTAGAFAQALEVNLASLDFGLVNFGEKDSISVELTNITDETVLIDPPVFFDYYTSQPFYVSTYPASIGAGQSAEVYVVFEPVHNMDHNSELVIRTSGNAGALALDLRGDCQYESAYYQDTYNLLDENLKLALKTITSSGYQQASYNDARDEMFMVIDNQAVNGQGAVENTVTGVYTGEDAVGYASRSEVQNAPFFFDTEHIFPQGFFDQNLPMRSDLHHLAPTKSFANNARGSLRFGEVVTGTPVGDGGSMVGLSDEGLEVFEPRDEQKGMSARSIMYFVVRYQNYSSHMSFQLEEVCRAWHGQFPPNEVDMARNESIFAFQNNRNPFVDYPQFADRIFAIRYEENRPNVGTLFLSHESIDFGVVADVSPSARFNLVLSNPGERFIPITNLSISNDIEGVYSLDADQPTSLVIDKGESVEIPVNFTPNGTSAAFGGLLTFNTNVPGNLEVEVPIISSTLVSTAQVEDDYYQMVPNPFSDAIWFSDASAAAGIRSISVYDISGRLCKRVAVNDSRISMQGLEVGFYQVVLETASGQLSTLKMLKQ